MKSLRVHSQTRLNQVIVCCLFFLFSLHGVSDTLTEYFSSRNYFPSSAGQLIASPPLGLLLPPLQITSHRTVCDGAASNLDVDFGDGSNGVFDASTYSRFGVISGSGPYTLTVNTDTFPVFNFTDFTLDSNYTLIAVGSRPLIIKVLRDVVLNGIIDCSGGAGGNAILGVGNLATGGAGKCGGGNGGNGGTSALAATAGSAGVSTALNAGAPATGIVGAGGAGGSGFNWNTACGTPGAVATSGAGVGGGVALANTEDSAIRNLGGGAGGGGGARGSTYSGAGGGGGGGHVEIYALRNFNLSNTGRVNVSGGNGGTSAGDSGGGGGGASGTVKIIVGGSSSINSGVPNPKSLMSNGTGGTSVTGSAGGNGAKGRIWIVDSLGENCFSPECDTSQNSGITANAGTVQYKIGTYTSTSNSYDIRNHHATFSAPVTTVVNGGSGTVTITQINSGRYVRFKVDMNNTNVTTPVSLDQIDLTYTPGSSTQFNFSAGCGSIEDISKKSSTRVQNGGLLLLLFPILLLAILRRNYQRIPSRIPS